jgi:hypothetical protein
VPDLDPEVAKWIAAPSTASLARVREIARAEIAARAAALDGCGEQLLGLVFVLYLVGEPEDVLLVDAAKHANFDAGCTIDRDFYRMKHTREALLAATRDHPRAAALVDAAFAAPNYETPEDFEAYLRRYLGL